MKKVFVLLGMLMILILSAGCGQDNAIMDNYSFGHQVIRSGNSEITVTLPFEIAHLTQMKDDDPSVPKEFFAGNDAHVGIFIIARPAGAENTQAALEAGVRSALQELQSNPDISDMKSDVKPISLSGVEARKMILSYKARGEAITVLRYVVVNNGVLWDIIYQSRANDSEGTEVLKYIEDKIQVTQGKISQGKEG